MIAANCDLTLQTEEHCPSPTNYGYDSETETLSLCDLSLHGDEFDSFQEDRNHSNYEDDPFEFSISEELPNKSTHDDADNMIFCGRLVPLGSPAKVDIAAHKTKKRRLFFSIRWKVRMAFRKKKIPVPYKKVKDEEHHNNNGDEIRSSAPEKYRWYLLLFGSARFPIAMELQDIRTRQTRRNCNSNKHHHNYLTECHRSDGNEDVKVNSGNWGLWRLIKTIVADPAVVNMKEEMLLPIKC